MCKKERDLTSVKLELPLFKFENLTIGLTFLLQICYKKKKKNVDQT